MWGPTTRCVRDAAIYLDATAGYDGRDPDSIVHAAASWIPSSISTATSSSNNNLIARFEAAVMNAIGRNAAEQPPSIPSASIAAAAAAPPSTTPTRAPLRVLFMRQLIDGLAEQPDLGRRVDECFGNVKALLATLAASGVKVTSRSLTANEVGLPKFGQEWVTAVGAFRLARFGRAGYTTPAVASKIDNAITSAWPAIRADFSVESQGEMFAKVAECNHVLATKVFNAADVLVTVSLGMEAYGAKGPAAFPDDPTAPDPFQVMMPFNYSGHPSLILRAGLTDNGLPCGIQIVGDRGSEETLLAIAAMYEEQFGPFRTWPKYPFRAVASGGGGALSGGGRAGVVAASKL